MIGDLDHFKRVNDQLGHRAGDRALVRVARMLTAHRRAGDTVARTGGEEFTLLLPNTSEHDAYLAAERMRTASLEQEFADGPGAAHVQLRRRDLPRPRRPPPTP